MDIAHRNGSEDRLPLTTVKEQLLRLQILFPRSLRAMLEVAGLSGLTITKSLTFGISVFLNASTCLLAHLKQSMAGLGCNYIRYFVE